MRILPSVGFLSLLALLSACSPDGYYDENGNYISPSKPSIHDQRAHHPRARPNLHYRNYESDNHQDNRPVVVVPSRTYGYDRAGYYDYNGYYVNANNGLNVPEDMFPRKACAGYGCQAARLSTSLALSRAQGFSLASLSAHMLSTAADNTFYSMILEGG